MVGVGGFEAQGATILLGIFPVSRGVMLRVAAVRAAVAPAAAQGVVGAVVVPLGAEALAGR